MKRNLHFVVKNKIKIILFKNKMFLFKKNLNFVGKNIKNYLFKKVLFLFKTNLHFLLKLIKILRLKKYFFRLKRNLHFFLKNNTMILPQLLHSPYHPTGKNRKKTFHNCGDKVRIIGRTQDIAKALFGHNTSLLYLSGITWKGSE